MQDKNGTIDEDEFAAIVALVKGGKVKGLASTGMFGPSTKKQKDEFVAAFEKHKVRPPRGPLKTKWT